MNQNQQDRPYEREGNRNGYGDRQNDPRYRRAETSGNYAGGGYDAFGYGTGSRRDFSERGSDFERGSERSSFRGRGPKGFQRSDERIQEDVCESLCDADFDASDIEVKVESGIVTLEGTVESRLDKRLAEDAAESTSGVQDVTNHLRIKSGTSTNNTNHESTSTMNAQNNQYNQTNQSKKKS